MSAVIRHALCVRHADRPAVARCRECGQPYCRECVVEHESRLVCAFCLRNGRGREAGGGSRWWRVIPWAASLQWGLGVFGAWVVFYWVAVGLRRLPAAFHDGLQWMP